MVPLMRRRLAILLIAGWVILSCFDVLEDLEFPSGATLSHFGHDSTSGSSVAGWGALANNIVESAYRSVQAYVDLIDSTVFSTDFHSVPDFRAYFQLHKRYRVFLI